MKYGVKLPAPIRPALAPTQLQIETTFTMSKETTKTSNETTKTIKKAKFGSLVANLSVGQKFMGIVGDFVASVKAA